MKVKNKKTGVEYDVKDASKITKAFPGRFSVSKPTPTPPELKSKLDEKKPEANVKKNKDEVADHAGDAVEKSTSGNAPASSEPGAVDGSKQVTKNP